MFGQLKLGPLELGPVKHDKNGPHIDFWIPFPFKTLQLLERPPIEPWGPRGQGRTAAAPTALDDNKD